MSIFKRKPKAPIPHPPHWDKIGHYPENFEWPVHMLFCPRKDLDALPRASFCFCFDTLELFFGLADGWVKLCQGTYEESTKVKP